MGLGLYLPQLDGAQRALHDLTRALELGEAHLVRGVGLGVGVGSGIGGRGRVRVRLKVRFRVVRPTWLEG